LLARRRALILDAAPEPVEAWTWDTPLWAASGNVVDGAASKDHVRLNFFEGASLADPHGLFTEGELAMTEYDVIPPAPSPDIQSLDRLVGTWMMSGGVQGHVTYEWMEGGYFLFQHVDLEHDGRAIKGLEVIGHLQPFGEPPSADIWSRYYDTTGSTLDYVYELDGDTLTIWGGQRGSPAYYRGAFSADGDTLSGGWVYPGGGGYEATATRVKKAQ